jgi:hypothetical protein
MLPDDKKTLQAPLYTRTATILAERYAAIYPVIAINGPRQSGKTTLAKTKFPHLPYVSLEDFSIQHQFQSDPHKFLEPYRSGAIFDEVQHAPQLLSYLQQIIDSNDENGRFVITGSQNFVLSQTVSQSLAGRVGQITLLPLSYKELATQTITPSECIINGGYPRLYKNNMHAYEFYPSYISSYIERDVRQIQNIENLSLFKKFLLLCAGRVGQLLNVNALAQECGIVQTTARKWLSILEASYIVFLLAPYHTNFNKRLVKHPKLYFYDTGLAASLLSITSTEQLDLHFARGSLFENVVILEILKHRLNTGTSPNLSFWRDSTGREVDLIDEWGGVTTAFEIKSGYTYHTGDTKGLEYFANLAPSCRCYVVYGRSQRGGAGSATFTALEHITECLSLER